MSKQLLLSAQGTLSAAFALGVFAVFVFKPERIVRPRFFWRGCLAFVLSIVVPAVLAALTTVAASAAKPSTDASTLFILVAQPLLLAAAFLTTFYSLMPESEGAGSWWPFSPER